MARYGAAQRLLSDRSLYGSYCTAKHLPCFLVLDEGTSNVDLAMHSIRI
eukprot:SAG31_NODE_40151_length_282_cov_2.732240_1_plen_48_part_01